MEIKEIYKLYKRSYKVTTDTRTDLNDSIFFALKGDNFNGNKYAKKAIENGAKYAVIDEPQFQTDKRMILVENVLTTLQELARYHRQQLNIPIIALTGSNGKTTTKELVNVVLSKTYNCVGTKGNLNNHIGVPLTLLSMQPEVEIGVVEMGANHPDEIDALCKIALPDYGYITNFGKVHLEGFGSLQGVIEAKTELYRHLQQNKKTVFVNANDGVQMERSHNINRITFATKTSDYPIEFISANPFVNLRFEQIIVRSKLIGKYNYLNMATAIAIGKYFSIPDTEIKDALKSYIPANNRSQIIKKGTNTIILDAYNANPNSMKVALENLSQLTDKNKMAILGDMFEIGENSLAEHTQIVGQAQEFELDHIVLIGENFSKVKTISANTVQFQSFDDFKNSFDLQKIKNTTILIKASRGMALERILDFW
ncbi:MAG: UDP-N-acetylmuramoyl-tripeptide--D-alanyl-D-alanine ligase [Flavobacteriaceae bacterium]|nr:UDP-N-acetylmuramoyl-tripeptide--D-alanyl-D-alanine ligase [Flavobacteriaceae bacterium]